MPNIRNNSCYYLFTLQPEKLCCTCVYFRRLVSLRRRANLFWSSCFRPRWFRLSKVDVLFSVFWFSEFSFSSWISWFQNLEIFPPFLRNSCDEIIWWFWVTIVTVIFTCRYFKLSWNTSALSQSNGRNFSGSSINELIMSGTNYMCSKHWLVLHSNCENNQVMTSGDEPLWCQHGWSCNAQSFITTALPFCDWNNYKNWKWKKNTMLDA